MTVRAKFFFHPEHRTAQRTNFSNADGSMRALYCPYRDCNVHSLVSALYPRDFSPLCDTPHVIKVEGRIEPAPQVVAYFKHRRTRRVETLPGHVQTYITIAAKPAVDIGHGTASDPQHRSRVA